MPSKDPITCHVLNTVSGRPATGINCTISRQICTGEFIEFGKASTNDDGRIVLWNIIPTDISRDSALDFIEATEAVQQGAKFTDLFKVRFDNIDEYFEGDTFFPFVEVAFKVPEGKLGVEHFHIPLLLSRHSYSTYRGS